MKRDLTSKTFFNSAQKMLDFEIRIIVTRVLHINHSPDHDLVSLTMEPDYLMFVGLASILALAIWEICGWQTGFWSAVPRSVRALCCYPLDSHILIYPGMPLKIP